MTEKKRERREGIQAGREPGGDNTIIQKEVCKAKTTLICVCVSMPSLCVFRERGLVPHQRDELQMLNFISLDDKTRKYYKSFNPSTEEQKKTLRLLCAQWLHTETVVSRSDTQQPNSLIRSKTKGPA